MLWEQNPLANVIGQSLLMISFVYISYLEIHLVKKNKQTEHTKFSYCAKFERKLDKTCK